MKNLIPVIIIGFVLAGSIFTSCKKHITEPPTGDTTHTDTTRHPCDSCNLNKDSLSHAFTWKEFTIPSETNLTGVWVFGANDMIIVANSLWHFDGVNFKLIHAIRNGTNTPLDGALNGCGIFAFSQTDFWLVYGGGGGNSALHTTDGQHFDDLRLGLMNACWGTSSNDMFFVGDGGSIFHYDGTKFNAMTSNTTKNLRSVWGTSSSDVWACGANTSTGKTTILHYDGSNWQEDPLSTTASALNSGLFATWTCDSSGHHFVTTSGAYIYRKTDNGSWRNDGALVPNNLGGNNYVGLALLSGNSSTDFMSVGSWGWVGHWNGKNWKRYDALYDYSNPTYISDALSMRGNTVCVVGEKSGASWVAIGARK